jgi:dipeptidyl aminopeptidase/acylaminoacyl peptidase
MMAESPSMSPVPLAARSGRAITVQDLDRFKMVGEPTVSPDGHTVAFTVTEIDGEDDCYRSAIWTVPTVGGRPRRLTMGIKRDSHPRWSPDGSRLLFLSDRDTDAPQLWVMPTDGGEARRVTDRDQDVSEPVWSPDGSRIAFTSKVAPPDPNPDSDVSVITDVRYKFDGEGFLGGKWRHIFTVELDREGADPERITDGDFDHRQPSWSPNGREIAFTANRDPGWMMERTSDIWSVVPGASPRRLTPGDGAFTDPVWSPDGTRIACIGVRPLSDYWQARQIWTMSAVGGELRLISGNFAPGVGDGTIADIGSFSPQAPAWTPDASGILFVAGVEGETHVFRVEVDSGEVSPLTTGVRRIPAFDFDPSVADGSRLVCAVSDPVTPFELHLVQAGEREQVLTRFNAELLDELAVAVPESFWATSDDGSRIHGWLLRPPGTEGALSPAVLQIHGGPHAMYGSSFFHEFQVLAAKGYVVVYANPRGSTGYGEAFAGGLHAAWGENDLPDLMACLDHALTLGGIDPARLGVAGGSYGGFMTNWLISHSDRFKAAVTQRTISNLISMYGTDDIALLSLDVEFGGPPWGPQGDRYRELSPITYVEHIEAPLLILHAEEDHWCPMEQAEQLFLALKRLGREVVLVRFPDESHGLTRSGKPKHRIEHMKRLVGWFDEHL